MSRVLATSSERFHHIKIQIQKLSTAYPGLSEKNMICQLATSSENLVASTQFLVALATSESQFQALRLSHLYSDCHEKDFKLLYFSENGLSRPFYRIFL